MSKFNKKLEQYEKLQEVFSDPDNYLVDEDGYIEEEPSDDEIWENYSYMFGYGL